MSFALTEKQQEALKVLAGPQRHTLLVGGARSGKTFLLVRAIVVRALRSGESRHVIFRFRQNAAHRSIWLDTLPKVLRLCFPEVKPLPHMQDQYLELPNGSEIWISGLDDKDRVDRILGQEYSTLYFNECSQIPYPSVTTALTRLAQRCEGLSNRAYYDLNPVGTAHWTYNLFIEHKQPGSLAGVPNPEQYRFAYLNPGDNRSNIDPEFLRSLESLPERQRVRFLEGRYVAQLDGALWTLELIEAHRVSPDDQLPPFRRVVIAVDPSGAAGDFDVKADEIGIIVLAVDAKRDLYVLADRTGLYSPEQWGRIACELFQEYKADRVLGEKNFGGDMVRAVIAGADRQLAQEYKQRKQPYVTVAYKEVTASRGKAVRAEPVAAAYERGQVHHVGRFPLLEEEMANFTTAGYRGAQSPNRADALVHGATELIGNDTIGQMFPFTPIANKGGVSPWKVGR